MMQSHKVVFCQITAAITAHLDPLGCVIEPTPRASRVTKGLLVPAHLVLFVTAFTVTCRYSPPFIAFPGSSDLKKSVTMSQWLARLRRVHAHNVVTFRRAPFSEISGSLGDLGTLLPLMIALAVQGSIQLGSTLVFSGVFNVLTGVAFGIPLPVQPMKAIAAAAISAREDPSVGVVVAAGQWVGAAVLVMSVTGLLRWSVGVVPVPVVKGIQLGAGLSLIIGAGSSLLQPLHWVSPTLDNRLWAILAFLVLIATQHRQRFPYALLFFLSAVGFAIIQVQQSDRSLPFFEVWHPRFVLPQWLGKHDSPALWMAIGQLPLTTLNSIIAVCALSSDLLPDLPAPSVTAMGMSVGLMNLTGTWFGAMPVCHGAGGLAAQYRFGARSGASVIFLGVIKILLGLVLGETLVDLLRFYPKSLLGIMVIAAGLELSKVAHSLNRGASDLWMESTEPGSRAGLSRSNRKQRELSEEERAERWTVMLMTTAGIMAFRNDAVGFMAGMLCHWSYRLSARLQKGAQRGDYTERDALLFS
ncbi:Molybdate transporter 1 [Paramyrothecium foliicola]|nr:Molybdate transporter 1 [Paramyrothecium foliicola]